ncbi:MAG TPA: response regulator [Pirellulales bacterium]|jgi:putative two-component system response regulator
MLRRLGSESHIVVIDPCPKDYRDLTALAGEHGWSVHFLTSGRAAIQFAPRGHPALWMINVHLPDMLGFDFLEMLRELAVAARLFAIADHYDAEDERQACFRGADLYLCKDATRSIDCKPILKSLVTEKRFDSLRKFVDSHAGL